MTIEPPLPPVAHRHIGPNRIVREDGAEFVKDEHNDLWVELKARLDEEAALAAQALLEGREAPVPTVTLEVWVPDPLVKWEEAIQATDQGMPRGLEDVIDAAAAVLGQPYLDALAPETRTRCQDKKALRATRPA